MSLFFFFFWGICGIWNYVYFAVIDETYIYSTSHGLLALMYEVRLDIVVKESQIRRERICYAQ